MKLKTNQKDAETAFLNGDLDILLYMDQPIGFIMNGEIKFICKLKKGIYGLKQSARTWNTVLDDAVIDFGFKRLTSDECIYVYHETEYMILAVYVDDMTIVSSSEKLIKDLDVHLNKYFKVEDKGEVHYILGWKIDHLDDGIMITQPRHSADMITKFRLNDAKNSVIPIEASSVTIVDEEDAPKTAGPYRSAIGTLMYLSSSTRPDITFATNYLSRFQVDPTERRWNDVKKVMKYVKGTEDHGLIYKRLEPLDKFHVYGFADADWASDATSRRSTTGYIFFVNHKPISWNARKQNSVALSSTEAEYMALSEATQEALWIIKFFKELGWDVAPVTIYEDNQSCIELTNNNKFHQRTKHIDIRYHFIREAIEENLIKIEYIETKFQIADMLTKPLTNVVQTRLKELSQVNKA